MKGEDMAEVLEKTCENCEYEHEDIEGSHFRHCIHNAEEHFEPKINHEKEIRDKAIDEFAERAKSVLESYHEQRWIDEIAEQMKGGAG